MKHIFSQRLAGYLMWRGFVLLEMRDDANPNKHFHVFVFRDSDEIRRAIDDYARLKQ